MQEAALQGEWLLRWCNEVVCRLGLSVHSGCSVVACACRTWPGDPCLLHFHASHPELRSMSCCRCRAVLFAYEAQGGVRAAAPSACARAAALGPTLLLYGLLGCRHGSISQMVAQCVVRHGSCNNATVSSTACIRSTMSVMRACACQTRVRCVHVVAEGHIPRNLRRNGERGSERDGA